MSDILKAAAELTRLSILSVAIGLLTVTAAIGPGLLYIFFYREQLFNHAPTLKLVLLAGSISCPLVLLNCCILFYHSRSDDSPLDEINNHLKETALVGSVVSLLIMYFPILFRFSTQSFTKSYALVMLVVLEVLAFFLFRAIGEQHKESKQ